MAWAIHRLYDAAWVVALVLAIVSWPLWVLRAKRLRRSFWARCWPRPLTQTHRLWVHAVSVGELKIAMSIMQTWPEETRRGVLVTTSTPEGLQVARRAASQATTRLLPWDLGFLYRRFFGRTQPPDLVLVETELWPNLIRFGRQRGIRMCIVNGRLGGRTATRRTWRLFRQAVCGLHAVLARSEADARRFAQFGLPPSRIFVTGNIKYDFDTPALAQGPLRTWLDQSEPLVIFASMSNDELPFMVPQIEQLKNQVPELRVLWAPRQVSSVGEHIQACAAFAPTKRTDLDRIEPGWFVILDSMGELAACYPFADVSLVGGSFNRRGGQNFLESLQAGTPALIGPQNDNFRDEVAAAREHGAIDVLPEPGIVAARMTQLLQHPDELADRADRAQRFLSAHRGAIARTNQTLIDLGIICSCDRS